MLLVGLLATLMIGCSQQQDAQQRHDTAAKQQETDDHAGHTHATHPTPKTFSGGVLELKERYTAIQAAFAQPDVETAVEMAHESLHDVGFLLDALPNLAEEADLAPEVVATVKQSAKTMFECYGNIDGAVHHDETPDYQAESERLDKAMAALEAIREP